LGFDPCNRSLNIQKCTETPTPKVESPLGVWGFIPSHFLSFPSFLSWLATLQAFALVTSPRLWLRQSPCYVHNSNEMIMKSPCWEALEKYSEMGVGRIIEQMWKTNLDNRAKIVILNKRLIVKMNWRHYKHPPIIPFNLNANLTSFKHHEPLFHIRHKI